MVNAVISYADTKTCIYFIHLLIFYHFYHRIGKDKITLF